MTIRMSFNQSIFANASAAYQRRWIMLIGTVFRVRRFCLLGQFLANFSVLTGCGKLHGVYELLSQPIENKRETQLTATFLKCSISVFLNS